MLAAVALAFSKKFPATGTFLVANLLVFILDIASPTRTTIPQWNGAQPVPPMSLLQAELAFNGPNLAHLQPLGFLQLFTSMFMHSGLLHIAGNSLFLFAFGMPFEQRIGARRFAVIYIVGGLVASLVEFAVVPLGISLGASGAISAIMGAFAMKYPRLIVRLPVPIFVVTMMMPVPVVLGVGIYLVLNIVETAALGGNLAGSGVGYGAHIGGMVAGALLALVLLRHVSATGGKEGRVAVDLPKLAPFARDDATRRVLTHMQTNHDEPEVFQAWLDRFFRTATCPTCTQRVMPGSRGQIVCTAGHKFDVRIGSSHSAPAAGPPLPP